jgi:transcriptional regulator with XRE-family HTH domain
MLGGELRRLRERAFLTGQDLKRLLGWSTSKISRIENARISISLEDLESLLELYGVSLAERERLTSLYRSGPTQAWWRTYSAQGEIFLQFLDFEAVAEQIDIWELRVVPGLLQTERYARSLLSAWTRIDTGLTPRAIEERIHVRMRRQARLIDDEKMQLNVVIDESVLLRRIGDTAVMHEQLLKLVDVAGLPNIALHVLPLDASRQIIEGNFLLLTLSTSSDLRERLLYVDLAGSMDQIATDEARIHEFQRLFEELMSYALPQNQSRDLIAYHARQHWVYPRKTTGERSI